MVAEPLERAVLSKVAWRLIPFMFILYIVAYLDRVNVSFAKLTMNKDLGFSDAVYGLGGGIFFIGYFLFEIPSNLILERVGARLWIARIMVTWGIISSAMMLVKGPASFYTLRFLLGAAEAGFFPGMILYLTYWFPARTRARAVSRFMTGIPIASVIGGPLSGLILEKMNGTAGWTGWQWLFLIEGVPAMALGFVVLAFLTDRPEKARWLAPDERTWLIEHLRREREQKERHQRQTLLGALSHPKVWLFCLLYFMLMINLYGVTLWLPQIIKQYLGLTNLQVGLISAVPYLVAAVGMVVIGRHSDRSGERRWHVTVPACAAALGLVLIFHLDSPVLVMLGLTLAAVGILGALGPFWALPTAFLSGTAAAGGIALVNSVGNLGGFVGPYAMGLIKSLTDSFVGGLITLAASLVIGALLALSVRHDKVLENSAFSRQ